MIRKMKPICFIAARGGSKGVRRKNIRLFEIFKNIQIDAKII